MEDQPAAVQCRLCDAPSTSAFVIGDRNRRLGPGRFTYHRCTRCEATFMAKAPSDLLDYYPPDAYGLTDQELSPVLLKREEAKLDLMRPLVSSGHVVEIGPGPGYFSRTAHAHGYDVTAIEMDERYCKLLTDVHGVPAICTDEPAAALKDIGPVDAVVMWHVVEHLENPWEVLAAAAAALRPGGVIAFSTPNPESLQFRLFGKYWAHLDAPRHLQLLPAEAARQEMAKHGMRHAQTVTTDPVGLELNRMGWEYAMRVQPARIPQSQVSVRVSAVVARLLRPFETRGLRGAAYTSVFVSS